MQSPFKVDQLEVDPATGSTTCLIKRDPATGSFSFRDQIHTSGITLADLTGMQNISNVMIVGTQGYGAKYTSIQVAHDAVPNTSSKTNPYVILIYPGVYTEDLLLYKDGVSFIGVGLVLIQSALDATPDAVGNDHTITIQTNLGVTPKALYFEGLLIQNSHAGKACIRIVGGSGSLVGQDTIQFHRCSLRALSVGGNKTIWATAINSLSVTNSVLGNGQIDQTQFEEISQLSLQSAQCGYTSFRFDTGQSLPNDLPVGYFVRDSELGLISTLNPQVDILLNGDSTLEGFGSKLGDTVLGGDQSVRFEHSTLGDLTVNDTVQIYLKDSIRGSLAGPNAVAILDESNRFGSVSLIAVITYTVTFDVPLASNDYHVSLELGSSPSNNEVPWITTKLSSGFTINFSTSQTIDISWKVSK